MRAMRCSFFVITAVWSQVSADFPTADETLETTMAEHAAAIARLESVVATLIVELDSVKRNCHQGRDAGTATSLSSSSSSTTTTTDPAAPEMPRLLTNSDSSGEHTRISSRSFQTPVANITDLYVSGTVYWHGRIWGPEEPSLAPSPVPTLAPIPAPTTSPSVFLGYASCKAAYAAGETVSGAYRMAGSSGSYFDAYCEMGTKNDAINAYGWTHVATITNADSDSWGFSDGTSAFQDSSEPLYSSSRWESSATSFDNTGGSLNPASNLDYRSQAWHELAPQYMMVKWNGNVLFKTTEGGCFESHASLATFFAAKSWSCGGSESIVTCATTCAVASNMLSGEDAMGMGSTFSNVYFKAGEADGAQDGNKDRAYIRTTNAGANVDNPAGLGSFCSATSTGGCSGNYGSVDAGRSDDGVLRANTSPYTIFIM